MSEPMGHTIMPIQIRPDLMIRVQGIPHDLTTKEAEKICAVVMALRNIDSKEAK